MIVFARERFQDVLAEFVPLARREWEVATEDPRLFPFDPNWEAYCMMEDRDAVRLYTAREDGAMVGHLGYTVHSSLHSRRTRTATSDVMWLEPKARRPGVANRMLAFAEEQLRADGVHVVHTLTNDTFPALARLLTFRKHRPIAQIFSTVLQHA